MRQLLVPGRHASHLNEQSDLFRVRDVVGEQRVARLDLYLPRTEPKHPDLSHAIGYDDDILRLLDHEVPVNLQHSGVDAAPSVDLFQLREVDALGRGEQTLHRLQPIVTREHVRDAARDVVRVRGEVRRVLELLREFLLQPCKVASEREVEPLRSLPHKLQISAVSCGVVPSDHSVYPPLTRTARSHDPRF